MASHHMCVCARVPIYGNQEPGQTYNLSSPAWDPGMAGR